MADNILIPEPHRIISIQKHTKTEYTFRVSSDATPSYGQFFMLSIPKVGEAPISCSGRGDGWVEFTIRNTGMVTNAIFDLTIGGTIFLRGPYGNHFPVEEEFEGKHLLVICGGTAMAPVLIMLNHFYENPQLAKSVHLICGFKDHNAILFKDEIEKFRDRINVIATLDTESIEGYEEGMVTAHISKIPISTWQDDYNIVIVGPPIMFKFASAECIKNGAQEDKIWVSYERKMSCGCGKCGHCKIGDTYVCIDGPVFNYAQVKDKLID